MSNFTNKLLNKVKKHLNYTYSGVNISDIKVQSMYFVFFNDIDECLEFHSDKHYEFVINGVLNKETISFSIPYKNLENQKIQIEYDGKGEIQNFEIGFFKPVYKIWKGAKKTSHSIKGKYEGLFTIKDGFQKYIKGLNYL